ncbi:MAG: hypothetical protein QOE70_1155 [Chthoniobacter sp.]|nr:hypothetical protein [Chthoniobacter sp.]
MIARLFSRCLLHPGDLAPAQDDLQVALRARLSHTRRFSSREPGEDFAREQTMDVRLVDK